MEMIKLKNLSFSYPETEKKALNNINFTVDRSEFVVICGKSGCGKTTLLRHLKKNLTPYGTVSGEVLYKGIDIIELNDRQSVTEIGFVMQNPDNQLVTDKVWHELAFGLESLGLTNAQIRRRVAEMASFFDIQTWFMKNVTDLSGGQKQLLNLASIMVMQPKVLVLDEPTSQLDPIAASDFIKTLNRINRDLGTTIIISEHRLEELFPIADRVVVMDAGSIIADDKPKKVAKSLTEKEHPMFFGLPSVIKIYSEVEKHGDWKADCPLNVREGRLWLEEKLGEPKNEEYTDEILPFKESLNEDIKESFRERIFNKNIAKRKVKEPIIETKEIWFKYDKTADYVLKGLNLEVEKGELFALLGGNGVGKTTTIKSITGIVKPQRGSVKINGTFSTLPQNPQALFTEITVEEELLAAFNGITITTEEMIKQIDEMLELMEISHLRELHPYDLSGGEQQRLALSKILLRKPEILLLDEPTKGLDPFFKISLAKILKDLTENGITILMVSHDIEFCAEYADMCALIFDGSIVCTEEPKEFFNGNSFYTTTANRIGRAYFPEAVTWGEVASCVKATI
ncbi:MAG: energy-coupling factor ABC transporter ATP-binding protein [Ruminococcaceae bacterium]|nr:energy-coupling factor ABC transporter ATP-binding protein [Oscillospiraceae bacterium]